MSNRLNIMLAEQAWILADGSTGTNLFNMGLGAGDAPELWNETAPDKISKLYRRAVAAGSDLFLTNSFGSNAARLKLHNAAHRAFQLSSMAAEIGRTVADEFLRPVIVAGSVGPTGHILAPVGDLSQTDAVEIFHEQAEGLKAGGADVLWLETISSTEEFLAAAEAFERTDMAWCGTMSFDTAGRTMMGVTSTAMVDLIQSLPNKPIAFGANCGTGAADLLRTIQGFAASTPKQPLIAKGNAGIPKYVDGHIRYDGTPDLMADYACLARDSGAQIIGGCCGTMPEHMQKMRTALETRKPCPKPSLNKISQALGPFSSITDGTEPGKNASKRVRRRRHI